MRTVSNRRDFFSMLLFSSTLSALAPNGARAEICQPHIISGSRDNTIKVWSPGSSAPLATLSGHTAIVFSVVSSPDAKRLASSSADLSIRIWDAEAFAPVTTISQAHSGFIRSVGWSSNGTRIVSGSDDQTIKIWDATTYQSLGAPLTGHVGPINSVAWSPDNTKIASGSDDRNVKVWDAQSHQTLATLSSHTNWVNSVAWAPDGTKLVSGSEDRSLKIWDATTYQLLATLNGHTMPVRTVSWSPDGKRIASGSNDGTIKVWDAQAQTLLTSIPVGNVVWSVNWSPDGKTILSGDQANLVKLWNAQTYQLITNFAGHSDRVYSVTWTSIGPRAVTNADYAFLNQMVPNISFSVDVSATVWYPTDLSTGIYPLVLLLHGNHGTCRLPGSTDDRCSQELGFEPPNCPAGYERTPNHRGYDYLASKLASWGYVVASIDANAINCRVGAIAERGRLAQEQLRRWQQWNSPGGGPPPFNMLFSGKINLNNVGLMGHSRGGEGMRAAQAFNRAEGAPFGIAALFEVAPTDMSTPGYNAGDIAFSVILPGCDGDVIRNDGMRAFDRAQALPELIAPSPKAQQFIWGANHDFLNSEWDEEANVHCTGQTHITRGMEETAGCMYVSSFFRLFLGGEPLQYLFTRGAPPPSLLGTPVDTAYTESSSITRLVDDFSSPGSPSTNSLGGTNSWTGLDIVSCSDGISGRPLCSSLDQVMPDASTVWLHDPGKFAAKISWPSASASFSLHFPAQNVASYNFLSFRVAEQNDPSNPAKPTSQDFAIQLRDQSGAISASARITDLFAPTSLVVHFPVGSFGCYNPPNCDILVIPNERKSVLETVRFPLFYFKGVNLTQIAEIDFAFSQVSTGAIFISDIHFE